MGPNGPLGLPTWGVVTEYTNGELTSQLYHCEQDNTLVDVTVDASGTVTDVKPSIIDKEGNSAEQE